LNLVAIYTKLWTVSLNNYYTIRKHLQVFIFEKYHPTDISFGQIKEDLLGNYNIILL